MKLFREILFPVIAVLAAFIVGGIVVFLIGDSPIQTYKLLIGSAFSWPDGIGYTLFYATPLIFTGLAVAVAFRCGLLNIGAEGQLYIAAFAAAWVGIGCCDWSSDVCSSDLRAGRQLTLCKPADVDSAAALLRRGSRRGRNLGRHPGTVES